MRNDHLDLSDEVRKLHVIPELISHHLKERGSLPALSEYNLKTRAWETVTFAQLYERATLWAKALLASGLKKGDMAAMLLPNGIDAVCFDQGALLAGIVPVPLHIIDTAANCAFILKDAECKLLVTTNRARWHSIEKAAEAEGGLPELKTVIYTNDDDEDHSTVQAKSVENWLKTADQLKEASFSPCEGDLACLIYTSGTTGKPKGVMLTHKNIMSDVSALLYNISPLLGDTWLSFLPLSHMFERTTSYYIGLGMGNHVTFSRGVMRIVEDLKIVRPSIFMSVPRVYEKVAAKIQERVKTKNPLAQAIFSEAIACGYRTFERKNGLAQYNFLTTLKDAWLNPLFDRLVRNQIKTQFGGRLRVAVSGGAALSPSVAKTLIGLGIEIFQGYGMTETSPIISVNKIGQNHPDTVGIILPGIEARLGDKDELLVRGPQIMKGYWKRPEDTAKTIDSEGWLATGDQVDILPGRYLKIKGRIKEIIVTSTGEKVPPVDLEQAIETDALFEQAMIIGENRPYISALVVVNADEWKQLAQSLSLDPDNAQNLDDKKAQKACLKRIKEACKAMPQYGVPRAVKLLKEPWTIENEMLTATLKLKRRIINKNYQKEIESLYSNNL